jgi:hypothetical protein
MFSKSIKNKWNSVAENFRLGGMKNMVCLTEMGSTCSLECGAQLVLGE